MMKHRRNSRRRRNVSRSYYGGQYHSQTTDTMEDLLNDPQTLERVGIRSSLPTQQPVQPVQPNIDIPIMHTPSLPNEQVNVYDYNADIQEPNTVQNTTENKIQQTLSSVSDLAKNTTTMVANKLKGLFGGKRHRHRKSRKTTRKQRKSIRRTIRKTRK